MEQQTDPYGKAMKKFGLLLWTCWYFIYFGIIGSIWTADKCPDPHFPSFLDPLLQTPYPFASCKGNLRQV